MRRIALYSDVHANTVALEAVHAAIEEAVVALEAATLEAACLRGPQPASVSQAPFLLEAAAALR